MLDTETPEASPPRAGPLDFDDLYHRHWWSLVRLSTCLVDEIGAAEDVVQDAYAGLYRHLDSLRDPTAALRYLRTAVVNRSRSVLRRRRTARSKLRVADQPSDAPADHAVLLSAEHQLARAALATLPPRQREVLTLRYLHELDDAEIAAVTGLSRPGVRSASSRGLAAMRAALGGVL